MLQGATKQSSTRFFAETKEIKKLKICEDDIRKLSSYRKFCEQHERKDKSIFYQFGYETFGIILYGFCRWMSNDLRERNIKQVLFLSRDGYIIKKAFDLLPEAKEFNGKYIYVSRRSLRVPQIWFGDSNVPRREIINPTKYISIQDLLDSIGLDAKKYTEQLNAHGLRLDSVIKDVDIEDKSNVKALLDEIWNDVIDNSKEEYDYAKQYIENLKLEKDVAIVDIGWRGSMQQYLLRLISKSGISADLHGYYIAISSSMLHGNDMKGYLLNCTNNDYGCDIHRGYVGLIETLFLKTEGSTRKYISNEENKIVPVLYPYEYMDGEQIAFEAKAVVEIQQGALDFIADYLGLGESFLDEITSLGAFANLHMFATMPRLRELKMFEDFRFYNGSVSYLAKAKPFLYYCIHPKVMIHDFYGARWRIGFLKSLFKIPLPYSKLFDAIMEYVKK